MGFCVIHHVRPPLWLKTDWLVALTQAESSAHQRRQLAHGRPGNGRSCSSAASMQHPETSYDIAAFHARSPVGGQTGSSSWPHQRRQHEQSEPEPEPEEFPGAADRESHQPSRQKTRTLLVQNVGMAALPVENENAENWLQSGGSVEIPSGCMGGRDIYMPFRGQRRLTVGDKVFCALRRGGRDRRFCASRITRIEWNWWKGRQAPWFTIADGWCFERDIYGILCP